MIFACLEGSLSYLWDSSENRNYLSFDAFQPRCWFIFPFWQKLPYRLSVCLYLVTWIYWTPSLTWRQSLASMVSEELSFLPLVLQSITGPIWKVILQLLSSFLVLLSLIRTDLSLPMLAPSSVLHVAFWEVQSYVGSSLASHCTRCASACSSVRCQSRWCGRKIFFELAKHERLIFEWYCWLVQQLYWRPGPWLG